MFDNKSSEDTREEKLRLLLLLGKSTGTDAKATTPLQLNRILSRSEEEFEWFNEYDKKLFGVDDEGGETNWLAKSRKRRKIPRPNYTDGLTDSGYMRLVAKYENGELDEEELQEALTKATEKLASRRRQGGAVLLPKQDILQYRSLAADGRRRRGVAPGIKPCRQDRTLKSSLGENGGQDAHSVA
ncbi:snf2 family N-terminal domain-containing protein [Cyclospora cayetanensis]|uniref:Snf2 family N-terminal domain-containing protein n=1 Tax=Cyclospora cayetanensis TaxID=88456 RepID=A0A1D3D713_9EIME|nr:snf2 family N-terminal domain-containing protein [Cyclospora cayetanensis]